MNLKLRNAAHGDVDLELSNLLDIKSLKEKYCDKLNKEDVTTDLLRIFAMGKELKDELFIYSYDIMDESTIQVMIKKKAN